MCAGCKHGDAELAAAAKQAFAKIEQVLPADLRTRLNESPLLVGSRREYEPHEQEIVTEIRHAIRLGRKIDIRYFDAQDEHSDRTILPFAIGYLDQTRVVAAWCELRGCISAFSYRSHCRTFRLRRIHTAVRR